MKKVELSDFQRKFLSMGTGQKLFTDVEFEQALTQAKAEIMAVAIQTSKQAVFIEREACADLIRAWADDLDKEKMADAIINRIPSQRQ